MDKIFWIIKTFVKRTIENAPGIFSEIFGKTAIPRFLWKKTFMFSLNIKKAINSIPSRFICKVFSINAIMVLITQKVINNQKLKYLLNLV